MARAERSIGCFWKSLLAAGALVFLSVAATLISSAGRGPQADVRAIAEVNDPLFIDTAKALNRGDYALAQQTLNQAERKFPKLYLVPLMQAEVLMFESARDKPTGALPQRVQPLIEQAIGRAPRLAGAHFWMAVYLQSVGQRENALKELEVAKQLLPDSYLDFTGRRNDYIRLTNGLYDGLNKQQTIYVTCHGANLRVPSASPNVTVLDLAVGQ